jgi:hypothetical protein
MLVVAFAKLYQGKLILVHMVKLNNLSSPYVWLYQEFVKTLFLFLYNFSRVFSCMVSILMIVSCLCCAFPLYEYIDFSFHNKGLKEGTGDLLIYRKVHFLSTKQITVVDFEEVPVDKPLLAPFPLNHYN